MSDEIHFMPEQRKIFRFHNGKEMVSADPLVIRGQLRIAGFQRGTTINKLIGLVAGIDLHDATEAQIAEGWQAAFVLKEIVTEAFQLDGADMAHALGVLSAFNTFSEKKNPPAASQQTSTPSTEFISGTPPITDTSSVSS